MRPTLYLDVDGVLSPYGDEPIGWTDFVQVPDFRYHAPVSRAMADRLGALDAEIVWVTTWEHMANTLLCPLFDWPELEVLEATPGGETGWWKLDAVAAHHAAQPGPFMWIDDDLNDYPEGRTSGHGGCHT